MKKSIVCLSFVFLGVVSSSNKALAQDPIAEIIKQAIAKVIVAVDLKIQRLQTKTIWLQDAQKVIENTMSKLKLDEITGWVEKQRVLYKDYFEELQKVKSVLAYYYKVKEITDLQLSIAKEYKRSFDGIKQDAHFTPDEVSYMGTVYAGIIDESVKNLFQTLHMISPFLTYSPETTSWMLCV